MDNQTPTIFTEEEKIELIEEAQDQSKQQDFYEKLRQRVNAYVEKHPNTEYVQYIMAIPDLFHLICRLLVDKRVSLKNKLYLAAAIVYCVSPLDIIPDIFPGVGVIDDIWFIVKTLSDLISEVDHEIILEHWAGKENIMEVIEELSKKLSEFFSYEELVLKIQNFFKERKKEN